MKIVLFDGAAITRPSEATNKTINVTLVDSGLPPEKPVTAVQASGLIFFCPQFHVETALRARNDPEQRQTPGLPHFLFVMADLLFFHLNSSLFREARDNPSAAVASYCLPPPCIAGITRKTLYGFP